ncbi:hypothetical protein AGABI1DRAFT_36172 [Agaricus bisporus var. burnettii JB137-S8]|uniref:C2H2-type domain-containing protein n=1 Tax=Agaricus bisporus var. burnettii (strain JB137-S8 / ATCC MYA-4627 / FGSC 10392) TaxID=597362 RepID=K5W4X7_AGABU|nr:uncharacterized protein AGABI1DRAFT_36172 [Agaricus bisporus var. burnettii JB137-S8]EKM81859.1 hypothetical protein AGABI1DRAFT_36172 [Agaricus bisporus var. burnettii JB137-S8]
MQQSAATHRISQQWTSASKCGYSFPSPCADCPEPSCSTSDELTSLCTDQCIVIACTDPEHRPNTLTRCDLGYDNATPLCLDCDEIQNFVTPSCSLAHPYTSISQPCSSVVPTEAQQLGNSPYTEPQDQQQVTHAGSSTTAPLTCMWGNCQMQFQSLAELVGHVNLAHLCNHSEHSGSQANYPTPPAQNCDNKMPCLWGNCTENLMPPFSPGGATLSEFVNHLFQDHLGLHPSHFDGEHASQQVPSSTTSSPRTVASTISSVISVGETPKNDHVCLWNGCMKSFETCNDLMTHISAAHVGSGKPRYDCLWEGCMRNGDKGFSSKQKICRHLQSHTGYRPFQCPDCLQNFSEAATLQQHRRRHTQEKPYKCDFPGCGKSFAITGALTIHKRVHNGQKPFKCTYCGRGFAESSNLSKHLRTHTGERPYVCPEPECSKAFARPDQLTRHMNVHRNKEPEIAVS